MQQSNSLSEMRPMILARLRYGRGMFAALDQSGGSTPAALAHYGVDSSQYSSEEHMFDLIHRMRLRIITTPSFDGDRVLACILFAKTLEARVQEQSIPEYLWRARRIASFMKVDHGLQTAIGGVQLMKPIPGLLDTLIAAREMGVVGTKMRSLIHESPRERVEEAVEQQFALAEEIHAAGLIPIVEVEVSTMLLDPVRLIQECYLRDAIDNVLARSGDALRVMLKLTIPTAPSLYSDLANHPKVIRILALSGGFSRHDACARLEQNPGMSASFSRALLEDLRVEMSDDQYDRALDQAISEILQATRYEQSQPEIGAVCSLAGN